MFGSKYLGGNIWEQILLNEFFLGGGGGGAKWGTISF